VSDTTPLIGLSILDRFQLLKVLYNEISIPDAVHDEIVMKGIGRVGSDEVESGIAAGWVNVEKVAETPILTTLKLDLDEGEAESIALTIEKKADLLLLDERKARARARALGLEITGTIGILLLAREKGTEIDLRSDLEKLKAHGFRISDSLINRILSENP
jgi:predicted nucleic acid-binding protein